MRPAVGTALAAAAFAILALPSLATAQTEAARLALGRRTAETTCAECHQITPKAAPGHGDAPSFEAIANIRSMTELSVKVFLQSTHATMPMLHLSAEELDGLGAYIMSLRRR